MPDGENPENREGQKAPPQGPKRSLKDIFGGPPAEPKKFEEPDPDYSSPAGSRHKTTEEAREVMFRESAKRLSKEEVEINELAKEADDKGIKVEEHFHTNRYPGVVHISFLTNEIGREKIQYGGIDETTISFGFFEGSNSTNNNDLVGVKTIGELEVGVYTDLETRDKFLEYAKDAPGHGNPDSIYYFNENGDYGKLQRMGASFESGKEVLRSNGHVQFIRSEMTPEDFELAGTALGLIKQKLLVALGRTPPQTPDQDSNTPQNQ